MIERIREFNLPIHLNPRRGDLTVMEQECPFEIKRVFWITGMNQNATRGEHAHRELKQFIVAVRGEVAITAFGPYMVKTYHLLAQPNHAIYVPPYHWLDIRLHTNPAVLLVLASDIYKEQDYIRDFNEFQKIAHSL